MNNETFLVTGAFGCIGSWILRKLVDEEARLVAADLATDPARPRLLLSSAELEQITVVQTDITDLSALKQVIEQHEITHIIHLAGLQVPFCKANPSLGAQVNVVGTVNVFEAARHFWGQVQGLAYASSLAVLGPADLYPKDRCRTTSNFTPVRSTACISRPTKRRLGSTGKIGRSAASAYGRISFTASLEIRV